MPLLRDRVGDLTVRVSSLSSNPVAVVVEGIQREIALTPLGRSSDARDNRTGDAAFDRRVAATGSIVLLRALLDHECRTQWLSALDAFPGLTASHGRVSCRLHGPSETEVHAVAECMITLAVRLAPLEPRALCDRLARVVRGDRVADMRARALDTLCARFPGPVSAAVAFEALRDPDPVVRFHAALVVGPPGFDELEALLADPSLAPHLRSQAARAALRSLPRERAAGPLLAMLVAPYEESVRVSAARALAGYRLREVVPSLCLVLPEAPPAVRPALIDALGLLGDETVEPLLLAALSSADAEEKRAAITALARVGTVRAVGPLRERGGAFSREALEAVARIQARTRGAGAGQLSAPATGETTGSLAVAEGGGLRIVPSVRRG